MGAANHARKPIERRLSERARKGRPPRPPEYDDEITEETICRLNKVVPDDGFTDFEIISGPAW